MGKGSYVSQVGSPLLLFSAVVPWLKKYEDEKRLVMKTTMYPSAAFSSPVEGRAHTLDGPVREGQLPN